MADSTPSGPSSTERGRRPRRQRGDPVGEPHRLPDVPHPVLRRRSAVDPTARRSGSTPPGSAAARNVSASRDSRELVQHRLHQRRVERVRHRQPLDPAALAPASAASSPSTTASSPDTTTDVGPVDRGDRHAVARRHGLGSDLGLGRPARRASPHRPATPASTGHAPPPGRHASSSDSTPATCAAANSPIECPARKSGRTPHDSTSRNSATSTANSAACVNTVRSSSSRSVARTSPHAAADPARASNRAQTASNASANTGNASYSSRPIPARCAP